MGSRYFARCSADERFTASYPLPFKNGGDKWLVCDWDQRRSISVWFPKQDDEKELLFEAVAKFIDELPADVVQVELSEDGTLVSSSSDRTLDRAWVPYYPPRTDFPLDVPTVRRRDLIELDRLGLQVDLVSYSPRPGETRKVVFKYYITPSNVSIWWLEANCVMRMPRHPNIVPFDSLVVDTIGGVEKVVGFTTRYIFGETLCKNKDRVFKLKYLEQLISVVDHLNLKLGIVHGDICPWNLLIDAETDTIQLFDFNSAAKLGWEGDGNRRGSFVYDADRNDVKFVIFTLYEIITREFEFRAEFYPWELDESEVMEQEEWVQHNDAKLDHPVEEYRRVLGEWVERRAEIDETVDHFSKASEPLDLPTLCVPESESESWEAGSLRRPGKMRNGLVKGGEDFLTWERPPTSALPLRGQRLLATGEAVQKEVGGVIRLRSRRLPPKKRLPPTRRLPRRRRLLLDRSG